MKMRKLFAGLAAAATLLSGMAERFAVRVEDAVQNFQTLLPVHDVRHAAHSLEVAQQVKANARQTGPRCFQAVGLTGTRPIFGFDNAVVSAGKLLLQDGRACGAPPW